MCLVITKKFYDGRLSSTPLHTLIEKQAVRFCFLKVALQLYQSHLVEELCIPVDSMASVVCFTLAENGCLAGVGRTIFFKKTKCHRTSISSRTMCKFLHFKSSISQLLWHFLLEMLLVKWQWVNFTLSKVLVVQCIQTKWSVILFQQSLQHMGKFFTSCPCFNR